MEPEEKALCCAGEAGAVLVRTNRVGSIPNAELCGDVRVGVHDIPEWALLLEGAEHDDCGVPGSGYLLERSDQSS